MTAPVTSGAVTIECFEWLAHLGVSRYGQPFFLISQSGTLFTISNGTAFRVYPYTVRCNINYIN
jgi:hypothetical protein